MQSELLKTDFNSMDTTTTTTPTATATAPYVYAFIARK
jgi:hypothetical protein